MSAVDILVVILGVLRGPLLLLAVLATPVVLRDPLCRPPGRPLHRPENPPSLAPGERASPPPPQDPYSLPRKPPLGLVQVVHRLLVGVVRVLDLLLPEERSRL